MREARHDPVVQRFVPDPEIVARAQRALMAEEDGLSPMYRYIRQQWEATFGAVRVALDASRRIWPVEAEAMLESTSHELGFVVRQLEEVYLSLDKISPDLTGRIMHEVLLGNLRTHEDLDNLGVPR